MRGTYAVKILDGAYPTVAVLDTCPDDQGRVHITRINVPAIHRGKGFGRKLLQELIKEADEEGHALTLLVAPYDGLDRKQLEAWYQRNGFKGNAATLMIREPISRKQALERS